MRDFLLIYKNKIVKFPIKTSKFSRIFVLFERKYGKFIGQKLANL